MCGLGVQQSAGAGDAVGSPEGLARADQEKESHRRFVLKDAARGECVAWERGGRVTAMPEA